MDFCLSEEEQELQDREEGGVTAKLKTTIWIFKDRNLETKFLKSTHVKERERWNLCRRPLNMTKDLGGKDRAVTVQYGRS